MKKLIAMLMVVAATASRGGVDFVKNGAFEDRSGWGPDGKVYSYDAHGGQNGSGGMKWENDNPKEYRLLSQTLKLKTGMKYRYSCRVRQSSMATTVPKVNDAGRKIALRGAAICVAWNDADGKWIAEVSRSQKLEDCDWTELVGETPPMPANAKSFSVSLYVNRGCTGRVWFDDVSVVQADIPPVSFLASSAYRDLAVDGEVEFRAVLKLDPEATPLKDLKAEFTYEGVRGKKTKAATEFTGESAAIKLPVSDLKVGANEVAFVLSKRRDGKQLGSASLVFERVQTLPSRKVYVDGHHRLVVDGKPFFPLGMYLSHVDTNMVNAYAKGPWNCALPYQGGGKKQLDFMASKNLKVIYGLSDFWGKLGATPRYQTETEATADCRKRVLEVKDHPAIIGWYVLDEMPLSFMPRMLARQRLMREIDPDHPTYAVLFQFYQIREYMSVCDILGTDPYPIADHAIGLPTDHAKTIRSGTFGMKSFWQVPQAFDWGWFVAREQYPNRCRLPTRAEARSMTWQSIAGGANGIVYWAYHYIYWRLKGEAYDDFYNAYCAVGEEVKRFIPVLLSVEPGAAVVKAPTALACRIWRHQGKTYLLVCNTTSEAVAGEIVLSERFTRVHCALDAASPELKGASVSVSLPPMGVSMLRLESASESAAAGFQKNPLEVVLTFDDAVKDHFLVAAPELETRGWRGIFCVIPAWVGKDARKLTWDDIRELHRRGHEIANHTFSHADLGKLAREGKLDEVRREIAAGRDAIQREIGVAPKVLCIPFGSITPEVYRIAAEEGEIVLPVDRENFGKGNPSAVPRIERQLKAADRYCDILSHGIRASGGGWMPFATEGEFTAHLDKIAAYGDRLRVVTGSDAHAAMKRHLDSLVVR